MSGDLNLLIPNTRRVVIDSADEDSYFRNLEVPVYALRIRETSWFEHRMFNGPDTEISLHVFSSGCPEIDRILMFRDGLRSNAAARDLYARTKLALARQEWKYVQNYADAKTVVIEEIIARAGRRSKRMKPELLTPGLTGNLGTSHRLSGYRLISSREAWAHRIP
jgi:GrpB protein